MFIIHKSQKAETNQMSIKGRTDEMWNIHKVEYYLTIKSNDVGMKHANKWMTPENIILSTEASHARAHTVRLHSHEVSPTGETPVLAWSWGRGWGRWKGNLKGPGLLSGR